MSNYTKQYSKEKKSKKKLTLGLILLICPILIITGIVAAFYSAATQESGDVTSGTLKISGSYTYYLNGVETQLGNMHNLNPGDVIVIKGTITNTGNKSAWIRDIISFSTADEAILPYLEVYLGEFSQTALAAQDLSEYSLQLSDNGQAATGNKVIDGSGNYAETENDESYDCIKSSSYQVSFTVYFLPSATNATQGKTFSLIVGAQALQFRNNNSVAPDETAWSAVAGS